VSLWQVFSSTGADAHSLFCFAKRHAVTLRSQLLLWRLWTRTPRSVEDDDCSHGGLSLAQQFFVFCFCAYVSICSATSLQETCTSVPSARSGSVRSASRYSKKMRPSARAAPWTWTHFWILGPMMTKRRLVAYESAVRMRFGCGRPVLRVFVMPPSTALTVPRPPYTTIEPK